MGLIDRFKKVPPKQQMSEIGRSGTVNTSGFISEDEFNFEWRWPQSIATVDLMYKSNPRVGWSVALVKTPLMAAEKDVEPASDDPEDIEVAAFVKEALFCQLAGGFDEFLRDALDYLPYGHAVFERVARQADIEFTYEIDQKEQTATKTAFVIDRLSERLPKTLARFVVDEKNSSKLKMIEQWLPDGPNVELPVDRLVIFVNEKKGDDWRGQSLLRRVWRSWSFKTKLETLEAIGIERSTGIPIAYPPGDVKQEAIDEMVTFLSNIRQGEKLYGIMPGPKQIGEAPGWIIELLEVKGEVVSADTAINRHDAEIALNVLAEFMRLGHENVGARATADVQQHPYYSAVEAIAGYVSHVINEQIVAPLVAWNYDVKEPPKFTFNKIQPEDLQGIAAAWSQLLAAGAVTPDLPTEQWHRKMWGAPTKSIEEYEEAMERQQQQHEADLAAKMPVMENGSKQSKDATQPKTAGVNNKSANKTESKVKESKDGDGKSKTYEEDRLGQMSLFTEALKSLVDKQSVVNVNVEPQVPEVNIDSSKRRKSVKVETTKELDENGKPIKRYTVEESV